MSGDEVYSDDETSGLIPVDWRAYADEERARRRHSFACQGCGAEDPARLNADCTACSECELVVERTDGYVVVAERGA